jgi:hypothetical protein
MAREPSDHRCRIALEQQNVTADDGVERAIERNLGRISLAKVHVAEGPGARPQLRRRQSGCGPVHPNDFSPVPDQLGRHESDVTGAAADVENPHPCGDSCGLKEPPRYRVDETRLLDQPVKLSTGMPENICTA